MLNPYKDYSKVDPQPGTPHRQIERSIFHALMAAGLSGAEYQLVFTVIEKSWGYHKTHDVIPLSQFEEATGLDRRNIHHYLNKLEKSHIIIINRSGPGRGKGNTYMFNKHWDTWILDKVLPIHLLISNGVDDTLLTEPEEPAEEIVSTEHQLASISVDDTPKGNSVDDTLNPAGNSVKSAGNSVPDTPGNSVYSTPSKERVKKLSKETPSTIKKKKDETPPAPYGASTEASQYLFEKTGRKRWANLVQKEEFENTETQVGFPIMKEAIDWALVKGISDIQAMITTAKKKAKEKEKNSAEKKEKGGADAEERQQRSGRGSEAYQRKPESGDRFSGFRSIESGPDEPDGGEED